MGYTTEFHGSFNLNKPLTSDQIKYLKKFADTRRMQRDPLRCADMDDPLRCNVDLPLGDECEFYVNGYGACGQDTDKSVVYSNRPPHNQPGLWCDWIPNDTGTSIIWNGAEKFYNYVEWIKYIISNFIQPWGYTLNGVMEYRGEDFDDIGNICIKNNIVTEDHV